VMGKSPKSEFLKEVQGRVAEPGPDKYTVPPKKFGPSYGLGKKLPNSASNGVPGPGEYDIDTMFRKVKRDRHGLGRGERYSYLPLDARESTING